MNKRDIVDCIDHWDRFDDKLYKQYLVAHQDKIKKPMHLKAKNDQISKVVDRYFRMKRKKILRKIFFFYSK